MIAETRAVLLGSVVVGIIAFDLAAATRQSQLDAACSRYHPSGRGRGREAIDSRRCVGGDERRST